MALPFNPIFHGLRFGLGSGQDLNPLPPSTGGQTPYTGSFQTGVDARNEAGNPNNVTGQGPTLGPSGEGPGGSWYGAVPFGGISQLGGRANGTYSGDYQPAAPGYVPNHFDPWAGDINGAPLSGYYHPPQTAPLWHPTAPMGLPTGGGVAAPHAPEPVKQAWAGGFGLSDNSAWGNKGQATMESATPSGFQQSAYQPKGHQNFTLPGAGSAFGMGGRP